MKRALAYLFAATLLIGTVNAQEEDRAVRFGIKFAPNTAWIKPDGKDVKKSGNIIGYTFGLMADFRIGSEANYAFSTGLFLNNVGGKFQHDYTYVDTVGADVTVTGKVEDDYRLRYIEIPLTVKLKTNEIGYMTYFGQIGAGLGLNIRAKGDIQQVVGITGANRDVPEIKTAVDEDVVDEINFLRTDLIVGAGFEYNFSGNTSAMVGVTYHGGFSQLNDGGKITDGVDRFGEPTRNTEAKLLSSYIELSLGVFF